MKICSIEGCGRVSLARGFCTAHYWRFKKFSDPLAGGEIRTKATIRKHPLYAAWSGMKNRCQNPNNSSYAQYGARGIFVCERWRAKFEDFLADMGERPDGMTLDRIDPAGPYSPENCRWATPAEQRANVSPEGDKRQREGARKGALKRHQERAANI